MEWIISESNTRMGHVNYCDKMLLNIDVRVLNNVLVINIFFVFHRISFHFSYCIVLLLFT